MSTWQGNLRGLVDPWVSDKTEEDGAREAVLCSQKEPVNELRVSCPWTGSDGLTTSSLPAHRFQ